MSGAAVARIPSFSQVLQYVSEQSPSLYQWVLPNKDPLKEAYDDGFARMAEDGKSEADFELEKTYYALRYLRKWVAKRKGIGFERPCCKDARFTWPFCNPNC